MRKTAIIIFTIIACSLYSYDQEQNRLDKKYYRISGIKHVNYEKLTVSRQSKYVLKERNFKSVWRTEGKYQINGDTLILTELTKTKRTSFVFLNKNQIVRTKLSKYLISDDGLKYPNVENKLTFYTKWEWRKRGKPSDIGIVIE